MWHVTPRSSVMGLVSWRAIRSFNLLTLSMPENCIYSSIYLRILELLLTVRNFPKGKYFTRLTYWTLLVCRKLRTTLKTSNTLNKTNLPALTKTHNSLYRLTLSHIVSILWRLYAEADSVRSTACGMAIQPTWCYQSIQQTSNQSCLIQANNTNSKNSEEKYTQNMRKRINHQRLPCWITCTGSVITHHRDDLQSF